MGEVENTVMCVTRRSKQRPSITTKEKKNNGTQKHQPVMYVVFAWSVSTTSQFHPFTLLSLAAAAVISSMVTLCGNVFL